MENTGYKPIKGNLRIIPLGGLGEIGKNLTVFESDNEIIIVDCGVAFPEGDMLGIDAVIPDYTYLKDNKSKIKGIFLTHGHEDHIGALPYFLRDINVPVYGTRLTIALVKKKLEEENMLKGCTLQECDFGSLILTNDFFVEFIRTNHSIADAAALAINTPAGMVIHTGDFKVDYTPVAGEPIDLVRLSELSEQGVLLLMADSTNAERKGFTMSEKTVGKTFDDLFSKITERIIVATFSSNIHRVQQIIDTAVKFNRKCVILGRSMVNVVDVATELGYIKHTEAIIGIEEMDNYPPEELVIITTGSQGEPMSSLTRMAISTHKQIDIIKGDTVIISASPIPGNEKHISKMINELFKKGANVIYKSLAEVHVSGHACQEELKLIQSVVKPRFFMPVHGEYKHLVRNKEIALQMGMNEENIFIIENGDVLSFSTKGVKAEEKVDSGNVLIDGLGVGDVGNIVLRDRRHLSEDGLIIVVMTIDMDNGAILVGPDVISRGFVYMREAEETMEKIKSITADVLESYRNVGKRDWAQIKNDIRDGIHEYVFSTTKRNPMILPIIMEISSRGKTDIILDKYEDEDEEEFK